MGLLSRIGGAFRELMLSDEEAMALDAIERGKAVNAARINSQVMNITGYASSAGGLGENQSAEDQVKHNKHWVYVAVQAIATAVMATPLRFYVNAASGKKLLEEVRPDHPLLALWRRPNDTYPNAVLKSFIAQALELTGDAYVWKISNGVGTPIELWNLRPQSVTVQGGRDGISGYEVQEDGEKVTLPAEEVIHIILPDLMSRSHGRSPLEAATQGVNTMEAIFESQQESFQQGINPSAKVTVKGRMSERQKGRLRRSLQSLYRGSAKHGRVVIQDDQTDISPWSISPKEMDFGGSSERARDNILGIYRVSKVIAGLSTDVNKATAYAAERIFAKWTVKPLLTLIESYLTMRLCADFDERITAEFDDPSPRDMEHLLNVLDQGMRHGALSDDEWREEQGWSPAEDKQGEIRWKPISVVPVERAAEEPLDEPQDDPEDDEGDNALPPPRQAKQEHFSPRELLAHLNWDEEAGLFFEAAAPQIKRIFRRGWEAEETLVPGEPSPEYFDPQIALYMRGKDPEYFKVLLESTRRDLMESLAQGLEAGEGFDALTDRVQDLYAAQRTRARNIAETETVMAQGSAGQSCRESYKVPSKEWVCSFQNSRESHMAADGQIVPNDKKFRVGGVYMDHPGDPGAPLSEVCRCHCQAVGNYDGKRLHEYVRGAFMEIAKRVQDAGAAALNEAIREYFGGQEKKVMAALRDLSEGTGDQS